MTGFMTPLLLALDVQSLTMSLVSIASPAGREGALADSVEAALRPLGHLNVTRDGDTVIARTDGGHGRRVIVAGHLGVASPAAEPLARVETGRLYGPGASDAKGSLAVMLKAAAAGGYGSDVTFVFAAGELDAASLGGDVVLLAEPTGSAVRGEALSHPRVERLIALTGVAPVRAVAGGHGGPAGVPAVAFGPGDPAPGGSAAEFVSTAELGQCEVVLGRWLRDAPA